MSAAAKGGFGAFLYLEVLDASFSFDGVIGAFALTQNLFVIAIGLGIGAMYVRSMAKTAFEESVARPSAATGKNYNRISRTFYRAVHDIISGKDDVAKELADLERRLERDVKAK